MTSPARAAPARGAGVVVGRGVLPVLLTDRGYVMAATGLLLMLWIAAHTVGSLKMYLGEAPTDHYSED